MSKPVHKPKVNTETLNKALMELADLLIEEEIVDLVVLRGKHLRYNTSDHMTYFAEVDAGTEQVESPVLDIFGQVLHKKSNFECECPKCQRTLAAARFAPHLEKCMGMGRNSSRIASRRLAASAAAACSASGASGSSGTGILGVTGDLPRGIGGITDVMSGDQVVGIDMVSEEEHFEDDIDDDEDWTMDRRKKKKGVDRAALRRIK